jgi:uncharacterized damage-inducible protein DinB
MNQDQQLREHLVKLMRGGQAFTPLEQALEGITFEMAGQKPAQLPYSLWQLIEHLRIAQWDILDFSRNPNYQTIKWPDDYWPKEKAPADEEALQQSLQSIRNDLKAMIQLVEDPANDLYAPFPHGNGQTLLREAMLVAEHNAYHTGQIVTVRRFLGDWK